jgi:hypothetical protein
LCPLNTGVNPSSSLDKTEPSLTYLFLSRILTNTYNKLTAQDEYLGSAAVESTGKPNIEALEFRANVVRFISAPPQVDLQAGHPSGSY